MFKWFSKDPPKQKVRGVSNEQQLAAFSAADNLLKQTAANLRVNYDALLRDRQHLAYVTETLDRYKNPSFMLGSLQAVHECLQGAKGDAARKLLTTLFLMFRRILDLSFPEIKSIPIPPAEAQSFRYWMRSLQGNEKTVAARLAYLVAIDEQAKSGNTSETALGQRVILTALAINDSEDEVAREIANEIAEIVDQNARRR